MYDALVASGYEVHTRTYGDGWVGDNTDPVNWPTTFTQHYTDMATWELDSGETYDIIAFKSCFPASYIESDSMLNEYKDWYNTVKSVASQHPETHFIPFTTPPLVPSEAGGQEKHRAREFANWMTGPFDDGISNMDSYDVFNVLAGNNQSSGDYNCLKYQYQSDPYDSHPNAAGSTAVANDFVSWLEGIY